jgi:hypothetical protein
MTVKLLLRQYGYPLDMTVEVVDLVMEQIRLVCQNESW